MARRCEESHPLSFARADRELCFDRIRPELAMPAHNLHFPKADVRAYDASWAGVRCAVMQGGQGEVKHWAFNDLVRRAGRFRRRSALAGGVSAARYCVCVELHPLTLIQNARTSGGGNIPLVPTHAITVGPKQTWQAERVSIWHPGTHDNPFGMRLTALMISKSIRQIQPYRCHCLWIIPMRSSTTIAAAIGPASPGYANRKAYLKPCHEERFEGEGHENDRHRHPRYRLGGGRTYQVLWQARGLSGRCARAVAT